MGFLDKLIGKKKKAEEEAQKRAEEEASRKAAEEAEAKKQAEEEAARKATEEAEAKRLAEKEAARKAAEEAEAKKLAEEEAACKAAEEAEAKKLAEEEAARKAAEEAEAKRLAEEAIARKRAEEEAARRAEAEKAALAEAERVRKEAEEALRIAEEKARRVAEEEAQRAAEEKRKLLEEKQRKEAEEEAAKQQAEPENTEEGRRKEKKSFWKRVKEGLAKTKNALFGQIDDMLKAFVKVDEDLLEELEEILICADVGVNAAESIIDELRARIKDGRLKEKEQVTETLRGILEGMIGEGEPLKLETKPSVILVIGVNGVGKTTSIGKISNQLRKEGKKVVVAAADTFRAAAIDQLAVWCERAKVDLIRQNEGSDPAAVVFDACHAAKNKNADVLIIDTAGRLHNKTNLMNELAKINRVIDRELPGVSRENLLVLDATTGQNAISQAKEFKNAAALTGLILNKMDGTAKGGIVISIRQELNIPVKFIGVGEKLDDMQEFDQKEFVAALFE